MIYLILDRHLMFVKELVCSLTLPDRYHRWMTDAGVVDGHHRHCVILSALQRFNTQRRLCGVVRHLRGAVRDHSYVALCFAGGVQADGQYL